MASIMSMLESIYAATINPNLKEHDRVKPRSSREFLPDELVLREKPNLKQQLKIIAKVYGGKYGDND